MDPLKRGLKALYYKGLQGAEMKTKDHIKRTFYSKKGGKDEPSIRFSADTDKKRDEEIQLLITRAWKRSPFYFILVWFGAQALSNLIKKSIKEKGCIENPITDKALNQEFTKKQVGPSSSPSPSFRYFSFDGKLKLKLKLKPSVCFFDILFSIENTQSSLYC
jgi:hypothetical protein